MKTKESRKKRKVQRVVWRHWCGAKLSPNSEIGNCPNYIGNTGRHLPYKGGAL
jgi:hypothetical protein